MSLGDDIRQRQLRLLRCLRHAQRLGGWLVGLLEKALDFWEVLILLQRHIPSAHDEEDARVAFEEVQGPCADHRRHRDAIPLDELPAEGGDVDYRAHRLYELLQLPYDVGLVLCRAGVSHRRSSKYGRLEEDMATARVVVKDVLLAFEVFASGHPGDVWDAGPVPLQEELLQLAHHDGLVVFLEDVLDRARDVRILHRRPSAWR
mmetsp:Transcript_87024/g.186486  ORF Transcript_87024/g.186486 Transcript_87024/m.186486 type:complete len:204 (-) Transcript_87024:504-1115(-)